MDLVGLGGTADGSSGFSRFVAGLVSTRLSWACGVRVAVGQAIKNVGSNWATLVLTTVVSFFLAPVVVRLLGSEAYGVWALIGSVIGYLSLIDLGVRGAVTKFVATLHPAGSHDEAGRITSAGLLFFGFAAVVTVLVGVVVSLFVDRMFDIPPDLAGPARLAMFLTCLAVAVSIIGGVFGGVIAALHRFDYLNGVEIAVLLARTVATVVALERGGGLVALAMIQLVAAAARTWIYLMNLRALYPELRIRLHGAWDLVPKVVAFGAISTLLHVSTALINYSDSIIIGVFLPLQAVTFFAIASTLAIQARGVISGISQVLAPLAGSYEGRGELSRLGEVMLASARLATLAILPIAAAFAFRGEEFIGLWMGEEFAEPAGGVLRILAPGLWVYASLQVCASVMMGIDRHRGMVRAFLTEAAVNVLLCIALVRPLGITGVALGILLPRLGMCIGFAPWYARQVFGTSVSAYLWEAILRPGLAMLPFALMCEAVDVWWPAATLWLFFAQIALLLPLAALGAWMVALDPSEREMISSGLDSRWRSFRGRRQPIPDDGGSSK
jgi:O-antigen/teichoic acid export membrane protein